MTVKSKMIIRNHTDLSDLDVLKRVIDVVEEGRVSNNGKCYCYITRYYDGVLVGAELNDKSDRFDVWTDSQQTSEEK